MIAAIPVIKIANDADALGIGSPDSKTDAWHAVDGPSLRPKFLVNPPFISLGKKVEIGFTQCRQERIRIACANDRAIVCGDQKIIGIDGVGLGRNAFKDSVVVYALKFELGFVLFVNRHNFHTHRARPKNPRDNTRAVAQWVHAKKLMRTTVLHPD